MSAALFGKCRMSGGRYCALQILSVSGIRPLRSRSARMPVHPVNGTARIREVNMKKYAKPKATTVNLKVALMTLA